MICERFGVDPPRAAALDDDPTWSLVIDAMIIMSSYRDTYVRLRKHKKGELKDIPADLPYLDAVQGNQIEMTKLLAQHRAEERKRKPRG